MKRLIFAIFVLGAVPLAQAADAVLKATRGHVSVRPATTKKWVKATPGLELNRNDQVMTGKDGAAQVSFLNGATMLVREQSRFAMKADRWGKIVSFRTGEFLIGLRHRLQSPSRFRVKTPVAVAAVRGTVFWGKHVGGETTFACFTGVVDVWAAGKNVSITSGQKTSAQGKAAPAEAAASNLPADYIQAFSIDGSLHGIDEEIAAEKEPQP